MKVTGPGSPGAPPDGAASAPEGAGAPDAANKTQPKVDKPEGAGPSFAETLAAGRPQAGAAAAKPAAAVDPLTDDIAADLEAGKIDRKAALDLVVERVLDQQLGQDAPAHLRDQLRDVLRDAITNDPLVAESLRGLG
jgi:hypothetical protein